jgi:TonB family protein
LSSIAEPTFLLLAPERVDGRHWAGVAAASVAVHILIALAIAPLAKSPLTRRVAAVRIAQEPRVLVTPLVAPPAALTQKEANRQPLSTEFNVASIAPRPENRVMPSPGAAALPRQAPVNKFVPPQRPGPQAPAANIPDAPSLTIQAAAAPPPEALGVPKIAPPQSLPPPSAKPKIEFETPGSFTGAAGQTGTMPRIQAPKNSLEDTIRQVARGGGSQGLVVGDIEMTNTGINPASPSVPVPGKLGSSLELQSDPMGVDFKPYLIRVLSSVKRNWLAVVPESARLGRRGKVVIQFAISKDGSVPKLVIALPSGAEALDRAAVAGISASNPFPPLPAEFKGGVIRLQLNFMYNLQ